MGTQALTTDQAKQLAKCEKTIEQGYRTFIDVGIALAEVRDNRLYKATHKTFDAYCKDRWGWERSHTYRLIDSAKTAQEIAEGPEPCPPPQNERQVRELQRLPEGQRAAAWAEAVENTGGKPTAAAVREVVDLWIADSEPPDLGDGPESEDDDEPPVSYDDDMAIFGPDEDAPANVIDAPSVELTPAESVQERVFARLGEFQQAKDSLRSTSEAFEEIAKDKHLNVYLGLHMIEVRRLLKQLGEHLSYGTPHAICPWCKGEGCMACKESGWVNKATYQRAPSASDAA